MSPRTNTQKSAKSATVTGKAVKGFTDDERAAMKERAQELKAEVRRGPRAKKADGESDVLAKIAEMPKPDRAMAERLHAIIKAGASVLSPRTSYGMLTAVILLTPCVTRIAQGQSPLPQPGARLRLTFPCELKGQSSASGNRIGCRSEGRLVLLQADTIRLAVAESTTSYGVNAVRRVEVSGGLRSHRLTGAGVGFLVGGAVAYALLNTGTGSSTSLCDQSANQDAIGSGACIGLAALGGVVGAGLGAIIGGFVRTERWQDVPLERLRVSLRPQGGSRLGVALAVAF